MKREFDVLIERDAEGTMWRRFRHSAGATLRRGLWMI